MDSSDIDHRFAFHAATTEEKRSDHGTIRDSCRRLAITINTLCPDGREKSLAITHLEEVMFWGNASLARAERTTK